MRIGSGAKGAVLPRRPFVSRKLSPALFAAILVAFALPFGTVSCDGPPVEFTGYELATWRVQQTTPPATTDDGESLPDAIERTSSWTACLVLLAAIAGLGLGLAGRRGAGFAATIGLCGLIALWSQLFNTPADAEPKRGFVGVTLLYLLLTAWHGVFALRRRRRISPSTTFPPGAKPLDTLEARAPADSTRLSQGT